VNCPLLGAVVRMMNLITMRVGVMAGIFFIGATVATPADGGAQESDRSATRAALSKEFFGVGVVPRAAMGAAINQANNTPSEWGQGMAGFGRRLASSLGKHFVNKSIHFAVARMRHEEFGFHRSDKEGFGPRLKYALVSVLITHKTTTGKPTIAAGELSGAFGSGLISRLWQPASTRTLAGGFASGGITLGVSAASHVVGEFWPEIRHPHRHASSHVNKGTVAAVLEASGSAAEISPEQVAAE
jgi:hypothetical protein